MGTAVAPAKREEVRATLASEWGTLSKLVPEGVDARRLMNVALLAMTKQPELFNCTRESLVQSIGQATQLGLEIGGPLRHSWLVPYKNSAQLLVSAQGFIYLGVRSGAIRKASVRLVYEGEEFDVRFGTADEIVHRPRFDVDRSDQKVTHAYVVFWLPDGSTVFDVMNRDEIERVRKVSKASGSGPWVEWWGEMAKKTVVKRGFKMIPASTDVGTALEIDNRVESGERSVVIPGLDREDDFTPAAPQQTRTDSVRAHLAGRSVGVVPAPEPEATEPEPRLDPNLASDEQVELLWQLLKSHHVSEFHRREVLTEVFGASDKIDVALGLLERKESLPVERPATIATKAMVSALIDGVQVMIAEGRAAEKEQTTGELALGDAPPKKGRRSGQEAGR